MKTIFALMLTVLLSLASVAFAQNPQQPSAEELVKRWTNEGVLTPPNQPRTKVETSGRTEAMSARTMEVAGGPAPGDTQIFALRTSDQNARPGQTINFDLTPVAPYYGNIAVMVVEYPAGGSGQFDDTVRVRYVYPQLGPTGNYLNGVGLNQSFPNAWSMSFRSGDFLGVNQIHVLVYDTNGWNLLQQLTTYICFGNCSYWQEMQVIQSTRRLESDSNQLKPILVNGFFPTGVELIFVQGPTSNAAVIRGNFSKDGRNTSFREGSLANNAAVDVTVYIPAWRRCFTLSNAYFQPLIR